ncbi:unnamed protein product [Meganyctiphanes norvegica]|uniref:Uncharacterized protein n=1 Tax=Meganyctiphanes norvegica TaxID=48144 RepID=A0AAV2SMU8_MEGNR
MMLAFLSYATAVLVANFLTISPVSSTATPDRTDEMEFSSVFDSPEDFKNYLWQLESFYAITGRPRFGKRGDRMSFNTPDELKNYLEQLETFHAIAGRPRFGKRNSKASFNTAEELRQYMAQLESFHAIAGRPRFGKRSAPTAA